MTVEYRTIRLKRNVIDELDSIARDLKCSRAAAVRSLLDHPVPTHGISRDRALALLAESAELGSITARVAYARHMEQAKEPSPAQADPLDDLRARS